MFAVGNGGERGKGSLPGDALDSRHRVEVAVLTQEGKPMESEKVGRLEG